MGVSNDFLYTPIISRTTFGPIMLRFTSLCKIDPLYRKDDEKTISYLAENARHI